MQGILRCLHFSQQEIKLLLYVPSQVQSLKEKYYKQILAAKEGRVRFPKVFHEYLLHSDKIARYPCQFHLEKLRISQFLNVHNDLHNQVRSNILRKTIFDAMKY